MDQNGILIILMRGVAIKPCASTSLYSSSNPTILRCSSKQTDKKRGYIERILMIYTFIISSIYRYMYKCLLACGLPSQPYASRPKDTG